MTQLWGPHFPARCLAVLGADLILVPQATPCTCIYPIHRDQLRVRAYENEVYLAMEGGRHWQ